MRSALPFWSCLAAIAVASACSAGCSSSGGAGGAGAGGASSSAAAGGSGGAPVIGGDRPVTVHVPEGLAPGERAPLVVMLHGYGIDGDVEELYLQLQPIADQRRFFYAHPNGLVDKKGKYYWNATDACCDYDHADVDDSGYLASVIREIEAAYPVDPKKVFVVGHSNGAFMAYRFACDHADLVAAIGSLAGATWNDASRCKPSMPVSVVEIHGTADTEVFYDGSTKEDYPSAEVTVTDWATYDGCSSAPTTTAHALDLDQNEKGKETDVERFAGCKASSEVDLWTMQGGSHLPDLTASFRTELVDFLFAHARD